MAVITSYSTLQTAVADYLARSDLTTFIPNFIQNCENKLYRTLNLRNEETALSVTIASNVAAVPTGFKAMKYCYIDGSPIKPLTWVTLTELYRDYPVRGSVAGVPTVITREATNFIFGPQATNGTTLKGIYYKKLDPLRTTDGSWYVTNAPELLLYGSLVEAAPFIQDDAAVARWSQLYNDALETVKQEEANSAQSQAVIIQRVS